jgi:hypothetical protein
MMTYTTTVTLRGFHGAVLVDRRIVAMTPPTHDRTRARTMALDLRSIVMRHM